MIDFFNGSKLFERCWPEISKNIDKIFVHGKFSHGIMVENFEQAIRDYTGAKYAIAVNNGTDALVLLLRAAGVGPGDEVIVPAYSFFASASSVSLVGATPVFVDIEKDSYAIDPYKIEQAVSEKTKAIMPVHLFTQLADMKTILEIAQKHQLMVIEDSAEAIGMWYESIHAGLLGVGGVLSFFPTKTLGTIGDAGMIITNNDSIATQAQLTRHHGRTGKTLAHLPGIANEAVFIGTNSKMDDIQAAVLLAKLEYLDENINKRQNLAELYDQKLANIPAVSCPKIVERSFKASHVYYVYLIQAERRDELVTYLEGRGIMTEIYYPYPLPFQPVYVSDHKPGDFPVSEEYAQKGLALPFHSDLTAMEVTEVCDALHDFYNKVIS